MTINLTLHPVLTNPLFNAVGIVDSLVFKMTVKSASTTMISLAGGGYKAKVMGSGFTFTTIAGDSYLNGGTIKSIDVNKSGQNAADFTGMSLSGSALFNAVVAEENGNKAAVENLFFNQRWVITSNNNPDVLTKSSKTSDGIKVNLKGNDVFNSKGGNDRLYVGDGNDAVRAGAGNDIVWGGKGNDVLRGGGGRDRLFGEAGNDKLFGDRGNDKLFGGAGRDVLDGKAGNDLLVGGAGPDVFKFTGKFGSDRIKDYTDGVDKFSLNFAKVKSIKQSGSDTVITHADGKITVEGVNASSITEADFI